MPKTASLTPRMISDFCRLRLANVLENGEREAITQYLVDLLELMAFPPYRGKWIDWAEVAVASEIECPSSDHLAQFGSWISGVSASSLG